MKSYFKQMRLSKSFLMLFTATMALTSCANKNVKVETAKVQEAKKPNIIFILTDDQRWDAMGYAGNSIIETPEMDKLAKDGTYFKNAFVTTPICAASRASILTGLYERTHGYTFRQGQIKTPYMTTSYPVKIKEQGYYTGFFGKFGVNYKQALNIFDKAAIFDRNNKFDDKRSYFYKKIGNDTVHLTRFTGHKALQFIKNAPGDKPFCLSINFSAPHAHDKAPLQYFWQESSNKRYADITIPDPKLSEDKYFNSLPKEVKEGFSRLRWHWRYDTPEKYQRSVKGYYRMISEIDDEIGKIRTLLKEKGQADNTVIIFLGDNGQYLGERQLAGKWLMHDNSLRVPLIVYDPRAKKHHDVDDMVLNIDVTKTILDLAKAEIPTEYQGESLVPYVYGEKVEARETIMVEHLWKKDEIPSSEGIRSNTWKYFRYRFIETPEELYNLEEDPMETVNLAANPEYKDVLNDLRSKLDSKIKSCIAAKIKE